MEITPSTRPMMIQRGTSTPARQETPAPGSRRLGESSAAGEATTGQADNTGAAHQLRALQSTDRAVRAHEQAHLSVAGRYATSGANLEYRRGPDNRQYAVAGEVSIDTAPVPGDPQATLLKAEVIRRAALAPANPSAQDRQVAAAASRMAAEARLELQQERSHPGAADSLERRLARAGTDSDSGRPAVIDLLA